MKGVLVLHSTSFVYFLEVEEETTIRWVEKDIDCSFKNVNVVFDFI